MNIVLIRPPRLFRMFSKAVKPAPPLGLAFIAGALERAGHKVKCIDAIALGHDKTTPFTEDIVLNGITNDEIIELIPADTNLVGFSFMFTGNWLNDRLLVEKIGLKFPGMPMIAGGEHATATAAFCLRQCPSLTAVVQGEGEETVVELCETIEKRGDLMQVAGIVYRDSVTRAINQTLKRNRVRDVENIAWPAWHLFPTSTYFKAGISFGIGNLNTLPLMATRGCPYSCTFCSSPAMWGTRYFMRTPADVADEIEHLQKNFGVNNVDFYDLTAIIKEQWIIDFVKELISRKIKITWQIPAGTRSEAITREVARYLKESGCRNITYAPESGSPEILRSIKKKVKLDKMLQSISDSNKEGLNVKTNIIIGSPDETHKTVWETIWFLVKCSWYGVYDMSPAVFQPYPGTALFDRLVEEGEVNIETDTYFLEIIKADNFIDLRFYNKNISKFWLVAYQLIYILVFYITNYIFRPVRMYLLVKNVFTFNPQSRGEGVLTELLKRFIALVKRTFTGGSPKPEASVN